MRDGNRDRAGVEEEKRQRRGWGGKGDSRGGGGEDRAGIGGGGRAGMREERETAGVGERDRAGVERKEGQNRGGGGDGDSKHKGEKSMCRKGKMEHGRKSNQDPVHLPSSKM